MGYTTDFYGDVEVDPPLNEKEIQFLNKFNQTRRMERNNGPYFVDGTGFMGQGLDPDVIDGNRPPAGQPGLWCQWVPSEDGTRIKWDQGEKFYDPADWMEYIIDHFLKPGAVGALHNGNELEGFTFDHVVSGTIEAQGEDPDDRWLLIVDNNLVKVKSGTWVWEG